MSLNVKELKSKLTDGELDLSLSEIEYIPVREIAALKKVTALDLSCNRLSVIQEEFCSLTNLVRLDLSQNTITALPKDIGLLVNLQHLDLYKNLLKNLPLSFGQLQRLTWLDIKDNPLTDPLRIVCGDCLDDKQCKTAARNIVVYMQKAAAELEREVSQRKKLDQEQRSAQAMADDERDAKRRAEKKREKEKRKQLQKQEAATAGENERIAAAMHTPATGSGSNKAGKHTVASPRAKPDAMEENAPSLLSIMFTFMTTLLLVFGVIVFFVPQFCRSPSKSVPYAREMCEHSFDMLVASRFTLQGGRAEALLYAIGDSINDVRLHAVDALGSGDLGGHMQAAQAKIAKAVDAAQHWIMNDGFEIAVAVFGAIWAALTWLANTLSAIFAWIAATCAEMYEHPAEYFEKVKFYWRNLK